MSKTIVLVQTVFSKPPHHNFVWCGGQYSEKWVKMVIVALLCSLFLLGVVYFLQTGDLIKKTFLLGAGEVKVVVAEKQSAAAADKAGNLLSLHQIEELAANSGFVPVGQVQYIPLTTGSKASAHQLVSNIR